MAKNPAAVSLGRKGGQARARSLSKEQATEIARKAADARWDKQRKQVEASLANVRRSGQEIRQMTSELAKSTKRPRVKTEKRFKSQH